MTLEMKALDEIVPDCREDRTRYDIAIHAAAQLNHLRLGKLKYFTEGVNLCSWLQAIIDKADFLPEQYIYLLDAMLQEDLISTEAKTIDDFHEAVTSLIITLLGIHADLSNAHRAQKVVSKMHDFCLKLANSNGNVRKSFEEAQKRHSLPNLPSASTPTTAPSTEEGSLE